MDETESGPEFAEPESAAAEFRSRIAAGVAEDTARDDARKERNRRRVRRWWRPAIVALLLAAGGVVWLNHETPPEAVVADYLEALHNRDVDTALEYTESVDTGDVSTAFLTSDAIRDDWEVSALRRRDHDTNHGAAVDVTLTGVDGTSTQGRFTLSDAEGEWQILNPLINVSFPGLPSDHVQFNGTTASIDEGEPMLLFPGAYFLFEDDSELIGVDPSSIVLVPGQSDQSLGEGLWQFGPAITGTEALDESLNERVRAKVDDCAESGRLRSDDCPLWDGRETDDMSITIDGIGYDVDEFSWSVEEYPTVHAEPSGAAFVLETVTPGLLRLTGSGSESETGEDADLSASCELSVDGALATLDGGLELGLARAPVDEPPCSLYRS